MIVSQRPGFFFMESNNEENYTNVILSQRFPRAKNPRTTFYISPLFPWKNYQPILPETDANAMDFTGGLRMHHTSSSRR
jgi:hypothetical protein